MLQLEQWRKEIHQDPIVPDQVDNAADALKKFLKQTKPENAAEIVKYILLCLSHTSGHVRFRAAQILLGPINRMPKFVEMSVVDKQGDLLLWGRWDEKPPEPATNA